MRCSSLRPYRHATMTIAFGPPCATETLVSSAALAPLHGVRMLARPRLPKPTSADPSARRTPIFKRVGSANGDPMTTLPVPCAEGVDRAVQPRGKPNRAAGGLAVDTKRAIRPAADGAENEGHWHTVFVLCPPARSRRGQCRHRRRKHRSRGDARTDEVSWRTAARVAARCQHREPDAPATHPPLSPPIRILPDGAE
jgi:hypothetical protein